MRKQREMGREEHKSFRLKFNKEYRNKSTKNTIYSAQYTACFTQNTPHHIAHSFWLTAFTHYTQLTHYTQNTPSPSHSTHSRHPHITHHTAHEIHHSFTSHATHTR
jgi:hypothetical protein